MTLTHNYGSAIASFIFAPNHPLTFVIATYFGRYSKLKIGNLSS